MSSEPTTADDDRWLTDNALQPEPAAEPCPGCGTLDGQHALSCHGVDESEPPAERDVAALKEALTMVCDEFDYWASEPRPAIGGPLPAIKDAGSSVRIHKFLEVQPPMERALAKARAILANPAAAEPHQHDPTHHAGDTNAFCSKCGYFPLPLKDARRFGSEPPAEPRWPSGPDAEQELAAALSRIVGLAFVWADGWGPTNHRDDAGAVAHWLSEELKAAALQEKRDPGE